MRELRIQQIGQRPVLFPDNLLEEGDRLRAHIAGEGGVPVGKMLLVRPQVGEVAEVQPFVGELHGAFHRARILEHARHLRAQLRGIAQLALVSRGIQRLIRRRTPQ